MLSEGTVKLKKLEEEMAESKTRSLQEVQLLRGELEGKQGDIIQLTKQVEQRNSEVLFLCDGVTECVMRCGQGSRLDNLLCTTMY